MGVPEKIDSAYKAKQQAAMDALESRGLLSTSVPMMSAADFTVDRRLCLTVAAFLPCSVQKDIETSIIDPLTKVAPHHYFYKQNSFHITVQNIRTIQDPPAFQQKDILNAISALRSEFEKTPPLEFEISGLLKLSTSLALRAFAQPALLELVTRTRLALESVGLADNKEYVSDDVVFGNVTICRFAHTPARQFVDSAMELANDFNQYMEISQVRLISTNAVCHPDFTQLHATFDFLK